jgi:hypothetical protein
MHQPDAATGRRLPDEPCHLGDTTVPGRPGWPPQQAAVQEYARRVTLRIGATWDQWRAEDQPPLVLEGTVAVWTDGSVTIDVGDGVLRPLGDVIAEHFEARRDAMGDRFVGRVSLTVDLLATPLPPPGWVDVEDSPA